MSFTVIITRSTRLESELGTALDWQARLARERDHFQQQAGAAEHAASELRRRADDMERSLRDSRELAETYQRLAVIRLRNALMRTPLIGRAVQPVARTLGRIFAS